MFDDSNDFFENLKELISSEEQPAEVSDSEVKETKEIKGFTGEFFFLSNFFVRKQSSGLYYISDNQLGDEIIDSALVDGNSVEQLFQASKTLNKEAQKEFLECFTPMQARRIGVKVDTVKNWESKQLSVMERLITDKFSQNFDLKLKLVSLQDYNFINYNPIGDTYWGVYEDSGENHLGKILMRVRDNIIREQGNAMEILSGFLANNNIGFATEWIDEKKIFKNK